MMIYTRATGFQTISRHSQMGHFHDFRHFLAFLKQRTSIEESLVIRLGLPCRTQNVFLTQK